MRGRSQTIGTLGRAPARHAKPALAPLPPSVPPPNRSAVREWVRGAVFDNLGLKFLSMVLAVTVYLMVNDNQVRELRVSVGVTYTLPDDKVLTSGRVDEVRVTVRGSDRRLRKLDPRELRVSVDLRGVRDGDLAFTPDMVEAPAGLVVTAIEPRSVRVRFDKRTK